VQLLESNVFAEIHKKNCQRLSFLCNNLPIMHARKNIYLLFLCVASISCIQKVKTEKTARANEKQDLIDYLKKEFKVSPDVRKFGKYYLDRLKSENKSLQIDSIIGRQLTIVRYQPLPLDFVEYYPNTNYLNCDSGECAAIYFIRNYQTGKIYFDFINWQAGYIVEDYCRWSGVDMAKAKGISEEDIKTYSSIKSDRKFGDWELSRVEKKNGIEAFLNDEFHFKRIGKPELDSLFIFYDNVVHIFTRDSLIDSPSDLVKYFVRQVNDISGRYHKTEDLVYLKDQINLLIARQLQCDSIHNFQWIYKSDYRLRERMVSIKTSNEIFYTYSVEERDICF